MKRLLMAFLPIIIAACIPHAACAKEGETLISETAYEACVEYGEQYGISPKLIMAIIEKESVGQPDVEGGGCKGLMQISSKWHKDRMKRLGVTDLFDERSNILVGTDYLSDLFEEYDEVSTVLMVYNGDSRAFEDGYISDYAKEILERSAELEMMHGKGLKHEWN